MPYNGVGVVVAVGMVFFSSLSLLGARGLKLGVLLVVVVVEGEWGKVVGERN